MDLAFRDRKSGDIWVRQEKMFYPFMNASVGGMRLKDEEAHARLDLVPLLEVTTGPLQITLPEDFDPEKLITGSLQAGRIMVIPEDATLSWLDTMPGLREAYEGSLEKPWCTECQGPYQDAHLLLDYGGHWDTCPNRPPTPAEIEEEVRQKDLYEAAVISAEDQPQADSLDWLTDGVTGMVWAKYGDYITLCMYPRRGERESTSGGRHVIEVDVPQPNKSRLTYGYYREGSTGRWYNRGNGSLVDTGAVLRRVSDALGDEVPAQLERWVQEGP